jgi:hypothetical protein
LRILLTPPSPDYIPMRDPAHRGRSREASTGRSRAAVAAFGCTRIRRRRPKPRGPEAPAAFHGDWRPCARLRQTARDKVNTPQRWEGDEARAPAGQGSEPEKSAHRGVRGASLKHRARDAGEPAEPAAKTQGPVAPGRPAAERRTGFRGDPRVSGVPRALDSLEGPPHTPGAPAPRERARALAVRQANAACASMGMFNGLGIASMWPVAGHGIRNRPWHLR